VELLSILNPPITDIFSDPRVTSEALLKTINEQQRTITQRVKELSEKVKAEDVTPFDLILFAYLQDHWLVTTLNTKLTARQVDHGYVTNQLNLRIERLTKWLIGLTVALTIFALPLAIDVILKWLK
jgi:hypothetical protein